MHPCPSSRAFHIVLAASILAIGSVRVHAEGVEVRASIASLFHGSYLDLDRGTVSTDPADAEIRFLGDGDRAWVVPQGEARWTEIPSADVYAVEDAADYEPDSREPFALEGGTYAGLAVRTSLGHLALVAIAYPTHEDAHFLVVSYRLRSGPGTAFPLPLYGVEVVGEPNGARVRWDGPEAASYGVRRWKDGAWTNIEEISTDSIEVPAVERGGERVRLAIARRVESGWSEWLETTVSTAAEGVKRGFCHVEDYATQGRFALTEGGGVAGDLTFYRDGMACAPPGGIRRVGNGWRAFEETLEAPAENYLAEWRGVDHGDVFVLRTADGRFARLIYVRDQWYEHHFYYEFLAQGGTRFPPGPRAERVAGGDDGGLSIAIEWALAKGERFRIYRVVEGESFQRLADTEEPAWVDTVAPPRSLVEYAIVRVDAGGRESTVTWLRSDTFPSWWKAGSIEIESETIGDRGYSFSAGGVVPKGRADFGISGGADSGSSLTIQTPAGSQGGLKWTRELVRFGRLEDLSFREVSESCTQSEVETRGRRPETEVFWVKTRDGDLAQVRIAGRRSLRIVLEYILVPRLPPFDTLLEIAEKGAPEPAEAIASRIDELLQDLGSGEWAVRERATTALVEIGWPAARPVVRALRSSADPETTDRLRRVLEDVFRDHER